MQLGIADSGSYRLNYSGVEVVYVRRFGLFLVVALTNGDLWSETRFVIAWWQSYAHVPRY